MASLNRLVVDQFFLGYKKMSFTTDISSVEKQYHASVTPPSMAILKSLQQNKVTGPQTPGKVGLGAARIYQSIVHFNDSSSVA